MKRFLVGFLAVITLVSFTACGQPSANNATTTSTTAVAPASSTSTVASTDNKSFGGEVNIAAIAQCYVDAINICKDQISQEANATIKFDTTPPQDAYSKFIMEFASGTSSYDLILFEPAWIQDLGQYLEPIKPLAEKNKLDFKLDDVLPQYKELYCSYNGILTAIPFDGDQFNLFYNTDAFTRTENKTLFKEKYGYDLAPPTTWDQYYQMAEFFGGIDWNGDGKNDYGTVEAWQRGGYAYWWWMAKFAGYGGVYFDENMNPLINSPAGLEVMKQTVKLVKSVPPGTANFGYPECENSFIKGESAMVIQWSSTGKTAMDPSKSSIVDKVGITVLPGQQIGDKQVIRPVMPTGWSFGIPKFSKNKDTASKVLEIVSRPENTLAMVTNAATAADPWRLSSFESNKWSELYPGNKQFGQDLINVQKKTIETALPDLQIPGSDEYVKALDTEISYAISGQKTPEKALADAEKEWNSITDRRGKDVQLAAWKNQYDSLKKMGITYIPYSK